MENNQSKNKYHLTLIVFLMIIVTMGSVYTIRRVSTIRWNYIVYIAGSAVFILGFISSRFWGDKLTKIPLVWKRLSANMIGCFLLIYLLLVFYHETDLQPFAFAGTDYIWHDIPFLFILPIMLLLGILGNLFAGKRAKVPGRIQRRIVQLVSAGMCFASVFCVNIFTGDYTHGDAFMHAIYVFLNGAPFDRNAKQIYGFYAILYAVPVKIVDLFTDTWTAMVICVGLAAALCGFGFCKVLDKLITNDHLYSSAAFAGIISYVAKRNFNYWQLWPHRVLFPVLVLFALTTWQGEKEKRNRFFTLLLCVLAIINNFETGLICVIVISAFEVYRLFQEKHVSWKRLGWNIIRLITQAAIVVLCAYGIVNLVNHSMGGPWIGPGSFLFPIVGGANFGNNLYMDLPPMPTSWSLYLFVLLSGICIPLMHTSIMGNPSKEGPVDAVFASALMGMGVAYYYFNRAAYFNLDICILPFVIILAYYLDETIKGTPGEKIKVKDHLLAVRDHSVSFVFLGLLTVMCAGTIVNFPIRIQGRVQRGDFCYDDLKDGKEWITTYLPEDTFFYGKGLEMLCGYSDRKLNCYCTNTGDIVRNKQLLSYVQEEYKNHDTLVLDVISDKYIDAMSDYTFLGNYQLYQVWSKNPEVIESYQSGKYYVPVEEYPLDVELIPSQYAMDPVACKEVIRAWFVAYGIEPTEEEMSEAYADFMERDGRYIYDRVIQSLDLNGITPSVYIQSLFYAFESDFGENSRKWLLKEKYISGELSAWDCMKNVMHSARTFARMEPKQ